MRWTDIPRDPRTRTLREFALCFLVLSGVLAWWFDGRVSVIVAVVAAVFGLMGLVRPNILRPLFIAWMTAVFPVAWLVSTFILLLIYFTIITPMALTFRLIGRDALGRRFDASRPSYWEDRPQPESLDRYFRQY